MSPLIFDFPNSSALSKRIREEVKGEEGKILTHHFPDGETYLRVLSSVKERDIIVQASLSYPNNCILNLLFLAAALRAQGAKRIGLLAPYLPYMRQDKVFHPGEALTSVTFAKLLSSSFNYLITVDPHLHRYHSLSDIYSIPTDVVKAAPLLSKWIQENVKDPFIIGPDRESIQWVKEIAKNFPHLVLNKIRHEDGHVEIIWPDIKEIENKTPVLVDDIISSGETMLHAIHYLKRQGKKPPLCMAIHPLFAENSYQKILDAGVEDIVTCNSLPHPSNQIDLAPLIASTLKIIVNED